MINYQYLADSIEHYEKRGFKRIESPWTVSKSISYITKPPVASDFTITEKDKVLVASGEQSFLALYNKGFLPVGQYQTITPCFRNDIFTPYHTKYFIKNELIKTDKVNAFELNGVIHAAFSLFKSYFRDDDAGLKVKEIVANLAYDIIYCDGNIELELGSYGMRECEFLKWIFGTGIAEPRFSRVIEKYGKTE